MHNPESNVPASEFQTPDKTERRFYDQGWNARVAGAPYTTRSTIDWQDGWKDCDEAAPEHRKEI